MNTFDNRATTAQLQMLTNHSTIEEFSLYLPIKKIAEHYGRHPDTIKSWCRSGKFPQPVLLPSGRPAWPESVLDYAEPSSTALRDAK